MRIGAPLPDINDPNTYLTASASAGATALTVSNNAGFSANDYTVIGKAGQDSATIRKISTVSGSTTLNYVGDAITFALSVNTQVTYIKYNQVRFYLGDWSTRYETGTVSINKDSATLTGSGTSWGSITTAYALFLNGKWHDIKSVDSTTQITLTENYTDEDLESSDYALVSFTVQTTIDIDITQDETIWDDTDALMEDYYRTSYYNETSTAESAKSSIISASETTGFSDFCLKQLEDEVLSELRDKEAKRRSRDEIDVDINNALREMTNEVVAKVNEDYLNTYDTINFKANREEYPLFNDFRKLTAIWISFDGTDYEKAIPMRIWDDVPDATYNESEPRYYLRDNVIGVRPSPASAVTAGVKMWYERRIPSLKYEGDELPYIFRDFKRAIVAYALEKACLADDNKKSQGYRLEFMQGKLDMVNVLKDRDLDSTRTIEVTSDEDLYE